MQLLGPQSMTELDSKAYWYWYCGSCSVGEEAHGWSGIIYIAELACTYLIAQKKKVKLLN